MKNKAILLMIFSSVLFTLMGVFVKLGAKEIPLMEQIFYRNLPLLLFTFYQLKHKGQSLLPKKENRLFVFLRATLGFSSMVALFYASANLDLSVVQVLYRTSPMWLGLMAFILVKERYGWNKFIALLLAFLGTVLILRPQGQLGLLPGILGLYSAFSVSLCYLLIHQLRDREESLLILFWFSLACVLLSAIFLPFSYVSPDGTQWLYLLLIALTGGLEQRAVTLAYQLAATGDIGIFDYSGIVISPLLGWAVFGEKLFVIQILGISLFLFAALLHHRKDEILAKDNKEGGIDA